MDYPPRLAPLTQHLDLQQKATAAIAWAVANDSFLIHADDRLAEFRRRGHGRFIKAGDVLESTDDGVADAGLGAAFLGLVRGESLIGQLVGAVRVPLTTSARLQIGTVAAAEVAEGAVKPLAGLAFDVSGPPTKVVAQVVVSAEALRSLDAATQTGVRDVLASAVAAAEDAVFVAALTAAPAAGSGAPGDLLALVSDGNPRRPYVIGGFDSLLALPSGTVRDLQQLGVTVLSCAAASGRIVAFDATGVLIGDGAIVIETARHASMSLDMGGSPPSSTVTNLWQSNLGCIRAEAFIRLAIRPGASAWASV